MSSFPADAAGLLQRGDADGALAAARAAVAADPADAQAHRIAGVALFNLGRFSEAISQAGIETGLRPDDAAAWYNLATFLSTAGNLPEAAGAFRRALVLAPDDAKVHHNLANALRNMGMIEEAKAHYGRALGLSPSHHECALNLAHALAYQGAFKASWPLYEGRLARPGVRPPLSGPRWTGVALEGPLLLAAEQGMGDALMFARFLNHPRLRGMRLQVLVDPRMAALFRLSFPHVQVVTRDALTGDHAAWEMLMSLPLRLDVADDALAAPGPYLTVDHDRAEAWRARLGEGFRVGVVWAGNPENPSDARRSLDPAAFASLAAIPGVRLISLQKGAAPPPGSPLETLPPFDEGEDWFLDTAAVMTGLDLVITVDTSTAHLAGALGAPVWILLYRPPDWRWGWEGEETVWYPSARLFRQAAAGEWAAPLESLENALRIAVSQAH